MEEPDVPLVPASKVDVLLVIDNSAAMHQKQARLAASLGGFLRALAEPAGGHAPIKDIHVGVISSALGNLGGDVCAASNPRNDDRAYLLKADANGAEVPEAKDGFLHFQPGTAGKIETVEALEAAATKLVVGVGTSGCGLEAQLESMYRFLVQPDPPESLARSGDVVEYRGVDSSLLAQRKAFLRPDSALVVLMLTDEDDSNIDPRSVHGRGWSFTVRDFPGSAIARSGGTTAARGTTACAANPLDPACASCALGCQTDPECAGFKDDPNCKLSGREGESGPGLDGFLPADEDSYNVRMFDMKRRFGVDPQFPIARYAAGLTSRKVPRATTEHEPNGAYVHAPTCTNPIFAAALPGSDTEEICDLPEGPRSRQLVLFALVGGVPSTLVAGTPDWTKILGANPDAFDYTGIDPHMLPSREPRAGLGGADLPLGDNGTDPIHGREWNTAKEALQYACTFELGPEQSQECVANDVNCDCPPDLTTNPPVCGTGADTNRVVRGRANPTIRELRLVKALGDRGLAGSICDAEGHGPFLASVNARLARVLVQ